MAKNIFKVDTLEDYNTMLVNGLPYPHIVLVAETEECYKKGIYVRRANAMPGDFVVFDKDGPLFVKTAEWSERLANSFGTPEAIVVAPSFCMGNDKVLCCSTEFVVTHEREDVTAKWDATDCKKFQTVVSKLENTLATSYDFVSSGKLPSDVFDSIDVYDTVLCAEGTVSKYRNDVVDEAVEDGGEVAVEENGINAVGGDGQNDAQDGTQGNAEGEVGGGVTNEVKMVPSPYKSGLSNSEYSRSEVVGGEEKNVLVPGITDIYTYSGVTTIPELPVDCGLRLASSYSTENITSGWFLPSCNHIGWLMARLLKVSTAFSALNKASLVNKDEPIKLLTSQHKSQQITDKGIDGYVWVLNTTTGMIEPVKDNRDSRYKALAFALI